MDNATPPLARRVLPEARKKQSADTRLAKALKVIELIVGAHRQAASGGSLTLDLHFDKAGLVARAVVTEKNTF